MRLFTVAVDGVDTVVAGAGVGVAAGAVVDVMGFCGELAGAGSVVVTF